MRGTKSFSRGKFPHFGFGLHRVRRWPDPLLFGSCVSIGAYSSMKFTCLSKGGGFDFPPCHILNICGFRVLFDVPLDLSALAIFSPVPNDASLDEDGLCHPESDVPKSQEVETLLDAKDLVFAEPWYKTVRSLHLWNASFIDVVLVSSPMGMLGLPFLTRMKGFSAEIYVTEATARIGKLMLEDLVSKHMEFRQFYGAEESAFPQWMKWDDLDRLPSALKEIASGKDGGDLGGWMPLYSAVDVKDCIQKLHSLKYAEETCYNGTLVMKAFSSGLEIGACNWAISSPKGDVAFVSSSIFVSGHAMDFDYHALEGNDLILYSDFSSLHAMDDIENESDCDPSTNDSVSLRSLALADDYSEEREKLAFICSCAVDAVNTGGSVLVPITRFGIVLQLLEQISASLDASNLKVPIYLISPMAEELLALTNIIPEWLCRERQEKLFSGEPSFSHAALIKEKKLHVFSAIYSPELLTIWQEPCIVFSPSWSLRLGPAVHLLRRWCGNQNSLLVLEAGIDAELALLPFKPMAMKVLQCSFLSGIKLRKIQAILEVLQPKKLVFPDDFKKICFPRSMSFPVLHYSENETLRIPRLKSLEVQIPMDLATQFHFKKLKQEHFSVTRLKGELVIAHGKHQLLPVNEQANSKCRPTMYWGSPDTESLLAALSKMGIKGTLGGRTTDPDSDNVALVHIHEPSRAHIQIRATSTVITASNENLASNIADAIYDILAGI